VSDFKKNSPFIKEMPNLEFAKVSNTYQVKSIKDGLKLIVDSISIESIPNPLIYSYSKWGRDESYKLLLGIFIHK